MTVESKLHPLFIFFYRQTLPFTEPKTRQYAPFWPSQSSLKEDIRKIQEGSSVTPVSPRQFGGDDDDAIHCNGERDMKDTDWFPSNRLEAESAPEKHKPAQREGGVSIGYRLIL